MKRYPVHILGMIHVFSAPHSCLRGTEFSLIQVTPTQRQCGKLLRSKLIHYIDFPFGDPSSPQCPRPIVSSAGNVPLPPKNGVPSYIRVESGSNRISTSCEATVASPTLGCAFLFSKISFSHISRNLIITNLLLLYLSNCNAPTILQTFYT